MMNEPQEIRIQLVLQHYQGLVLQYLIPQRINSSVVRISCPKDAVYLFEEIDKACLKLLLFSLIVIR